MTAFFSIALAASAVLAAWMQPGLQPWMPETFRDGKMAFFAMQMFIVLLAYVIGLGIPKWKMMSRVSGWTSVTAAALVLVIGYQNTQGFGLGARAVPSNVTYVKPRPKARVAAPDAGRQEQAPAHPAAGRTAAAPLPPAREDAGTDGNIPASAYDPARVPDALRMPSIPKGKIRIIVRDETGAEYPYDITPGEDLPPNLTNLSKMAQVVMAYGAWTEIKAGKTGHFVVKAEINNTPIIALIDTGASAVALSHEDAEAIGINTFALDYTIPVATANGVVKAAPVTLRRIEIDNVVVRDVKAWVMPKGALRGTLMGMSFLSHLSGFSVDNGKLTLRQ